MGGCGITRSGAEEHEALPWTARTDWLVACLELELEPELAVLVDLVQGSGECEVCQGVGPDVVGHVRW